MKFSKLLAVISAMGATWGVELPANAFSLVNNGGFENGFTGWNTIGNTSIEDSTFGSGPIEGSKQAILSTFSGAFDSDIENFLGLAPGSLDNLSTGNATNGSAIFQSFSAPSVGANITFSTNFLTDETDFDNDPTTFNDFAFFSVTNGQLNLLADTGSGFQASGTSFNDETGYFTTSLAALPNQQGTIDLGLGVLNVNDTFVESALLVDGVQAHPVPEPTTILGTLTALGFGGFLKRKFAKKA